MSHLSKPFENAVAKNNECSEFIYYSLEEAKLKYPTCQIEHFEIDQIFMGQAFFKKSDCTKIFNDLFFYMTICNNGHAGFAYANKINYSKKLIKCINKNVLEVFEDETLDLAIRISCADAAMQVFNEYCGEKPTNVFVCDGSIREKANVRSDLLTQHISDDQQVLLVGAVSEIARDVLKRTRNLSITECGQDSHGTKMYGIPIQIGADNTLKILEKSDIAIITGATMTSNTIDNILEIGVKHNVDMRFYLETGTGFSNALLKKGAKLVLSESFPFYDMPGTTKMNLYYDNKIRKYK